MVRLSKGEPLWPRLTRPKIARRDGDYCPHCGATDGLTVQHRRRKGSGGNNDGERPSNGIILCWAMNDAEANTPAGRALAARYGWGLRQHEEPSEVPVFDAMTATWWMLADDWTRREPTPAEVEEHLAHYPQAGENLVDKRLNR